MIKLFSILFLGTLFLTSCGRLSDSVWTPSGASGAVVAARVADLGPFTPGTFGGVGPDGYYGGNIYVDVTFDAARITAIEVTHHTETPSFAMMVFSTLIPGVLGAQTYRLDTVTGATVTSIAFKAAIQDAILQAGGRADDGGMAAGGVCPTCGSVIAGLGPFIPGTYDGVGPGGYYGGNIYISATFDATRITAIEVTHHTETPAFATMAFNVLIPNVIGSQSYRIDHVSGATATSNAFLAAVQDAVQQATE